MLPITSRNLGQLSLRTHTSHTIFPHESKMNISVDRLTSEDKGRGSSVFHINAIAPITSNHSISHYHWIYCKIQQNIQEKTLTISYVDSKSLADTELYSWNSPGTAIHQHYYQVRNPSSICVFWKMCLCEKCRCFWCLFTNSQFNTKQPKRPLTTCPYLQVAYTLQIHHWME